MSCPSDKKADGFTVTFDQAKIDEEYTNDYNKTFVSRVHIVDSNDKIEDILAKYNLSPLEFLKLNENIILINGKEIIISK